MSQTRTSIAPQIIDEASEWFVRMREPSIPVEHHTEFAEWLRASPVHVGAYLEIARLWSDAAHIDAQLEAQAADQPANVISLRECGGVRNSIVQTERRGRKRFALAASVLIFLLAGAGYWSYAHRLPNYATEVGEQRVLTLEDGSTVRLNSRSEIKVSMTAQQRHIELIAGQALFEVARDAARPFVVTSGEVAIRAVGTQFDVNQKKSGIVVTVVEGRVALKHHREPEKHQVFISAGEQASIAVSGEIQPAERTNTSAAVSWLQQQLIFEGQSLGDVIEELNRYARTPIVLDDPSLASLRINAVFHTTTPDSFLRYMSRFDAVLIEKSAKEIRLTRRE